MTVGFSLPTIAPVNSPATDPTSRGSGAIAAMKSVDNQSAKPVADILTPQPTGPSQAPASQAVTQVIESSTDGKIVRERPSDQAAISAATFEKILERAQALRSDDSGPVSGAKPNGSKLDLANVDAEPSFAKGVEDVRTMADPTGGQGESRLV